MTALKIFSYTKAAIGNNSDFVNIQIINVIKYLYDSFTNANIR
jgi:hypothetical protein